MTEEALTARSVGEPRTVITVIATALEVTGYDSPDGPRVVLLLDGEARLGDGHATADPARIAVAIAPDVAALLAIDLHGAAASALNRPAVTPQ